MLEAVVRSQGAEERLLERVLGFGERQASAKQPEHLLLVLRVEHLEGRYVHLRHHHLKRATRSICETRAHAAGRRRARRVDPFRACRAHAGGRGDRALHRGLGGGGRRRRCRGDPAGAARGPGNPVHGARRRRARPALVRGPETQGVLVHAEIVPGRAQRWAFTHVDDTRERTITTVGEKLRPPRARRLAALARARWCRRRVLRGRGRGRAGAGPPRAGTDRDRTRADDVAARLVGARCADRGGGRTRTSGTARETWSRLPGWSSRPPAPSAAGRSPAAPYTAAPPPAPVEDSYGAGDCFAAGLTYALAAHAGPTEAVAFAARCGAAALIGRGVAPQAVEL